MNLAFCQDLLSEDELNIGPVGFVVDPYRTGSFGFRRYVFNETLAVPTSVQLIETATGFSCSARPWYQMGTMCEDPIKVLCPTFFQGTEGLGTFQVYGDASTGVVVSQDIATWQLCQCLDDLSCDASAAEPPRCLSTLGGGAATLVTSVALVFLSSLFD